MWECDFPHSDSDWPWSPEVTIEGVRGLADETINAITHGNAIREFSFDPFKFRSRQDSTVGALRAEAAAGGVDTAFRSMRTRQQSMGSVAGAQQDLLTPSRL
jgi:hypothetical protein